MNEIDAACLLGVLILSLIYVGIILIVTIYLAANNIHWEKYVLTGIPRCFNVYEFLLVVLFYPITLITRIERRMKERKKRLKSTRKPLKKVWCYKGDK